MIADEDDDNDDGEIQEPDKTASKGLHVKKSSPEPARGLKPDSVVGVAKKHDKLAYLIRLCGIDESE